MDPEFIERLRTWKRKADENTADAWIRFIIYWMIFDAYITDESFRSNAANITDSHKLNWFYNNDNILKNIFIETWSSPKYLERLEDLKKETPIRDMRPTKNNLEGILLIDIKDVTNIMKCIYQIRCNTFHGAKDFQSFRDNILIEIAESLLNEPISRFLN